MKIRANEACPCGSGVPYARCHGGNSVPGASGPRALVPNAGPSRFGAVLAAMNATPDDAPGASATNTPRPLLVLDGFLDAASCKAMVEGFERNVVRMTQKTADPYWANRLLYYQALEHEPTLRRIMREAREGFVREIRRFYNVAEPLYTDTVHMVRWREGQSMKAHADNAHPDGTPNEYPWRSYASVLYLNDDYDGGEIYFEPLGVSIKPRAGLFVGFSGSAEHRHGVTTVTRGTRYTMPAWHTTDAHRRDKAFD
jgi:predicted 2-oxoglutarate/Fe(II)-dependent dioxygenase YbiX